MSWLYMYLYMRVIMYIINLFLCCVCLWLFGYVCVTTVFLSLMYIINIIKIITYYKKKLPQLMLPYSTHCHTFRSDTEIACQSGYIAEAGSSTCLQCPPGDQCPNPNGSGQASCSAGSYSLAGEF